MAEAFTKAFQEVYQTEVAQDQVHPQKTRREFKGDYTLNVFPFLKITREAPHLTAQKLGEHLVENESLISAFEVIKGFLNLTLSATFWQGFLTSTYSDPTYGKRQNSGNAVMVEYSSPNTNKPLHLGHLRNIFLGHSVANLLEARGDDVIRTQIINDRGIHICKSMVAWKLFGDGKTPKSEGVKGDKFVGDYYVLFDKTYKKEVAELVEQGFDEERAKAEAPILKSAQLELQKWEQGDEETVALWRTMNGWVYGGFDQTYATMKVSFDKLYYESETYLLGKKVVNEGLEKSVFYKREDGSVWCDLTAEGLDEKLVLRKDGTAVYMTQDIGTAIERFSDFPQLNQMIYTVGNEQDYHFKVLFELLKKLGYDWAGECYHLSYGMVELPHGKMKSREGTVVDADDLMETMIQTARTELSERGLTEEWGEEEIDRISQMIGLGALKYYILKVDPKKRMVFNPEESIDLTGNTAPFIQYTHARIQALLRRERPPQELNAEVQWTEKEHELIKLLYDFPEVINEAAQSMAPAILCNYLYDLVKTYNSFYQSVRIFDSDEALKQFRLSLSELTARVVADGLYFLGIDAPDRM